ncbi:MAG TPA: hypothetical protein VM939_10675 [Gemmatimonadaceae bacterium]|nr:hypothetical protein [Gemmatimonadaceae bacterium]
MKRKLKIVRPSMIAISVAILAIASSCVPHHVIGKVEPADIETTLFLIGDAGEPDPRESGAALDSLSAQAAVAPERSIIVFLGDNVYPAGIPHDSALNYADARRRLEVQVRAVPRGVRGIFVPGNHDWAQSGPFGLAAIRLQQRLIAQLAGGRDVRMLPGNGCPGPAKIDVGRLRLINLDTQWWLHSYIVKDSASGCAIEPRPGAVTAALRAQVGEKREGGVTVVTGHHPMMTGGEHGGYCGITGPFRRFGGTSQDILSSSNRRMRDSLVSAFIVQPPLVYAAGHEHNLQALKGTPFTQYLLVSGAGSQSKAGCVVRLRESYYVSQYRSGFMRLDIMKNKGVLLSVYQFGGTGRSPAYQRWLELR